MLLTTPNRLRLLVNLASTDCALTQRQCVCDALEDSDAYEHAPRIWCNASIHDASAVQSVASGLANGNAAYKQVVLASGQT